MKKFLVITLGIILVSQNFLNAQVNRSKLLNGKIGISFSSFGSNDVIRFQSPHGGASYKGDGFFTIGATYLYPLNKWLEIETGLEYSKHNIIIDTNLPPHMENTSIKANFSLINIPVSLRVNFLNYFFVNGGLLLDVDVSKDRPIDGQTGVGAFLGAAVKYDFKNGISLFMNPYSKVHSIIPFVDTEHHQRAVEYGIRVGITYSLGHR